MVTGTSAATKTGYAVNKAQSTAAARIRHLPTADSAIRIETEEQYDSMFMLISSEARKRGANLEYAVQPLEILAASIGDVIARRAETF
jgi:phage terminase small subunit